MARMEMAKRSAKQEDLDALVEEVARLETNLHRVIGINRSLVFGLNKAWEELDRLAGRQPQPRVVHTHVHAWRKVGLANFLDADGNAIAEGVTESCQCGQVRSRPTAWFQFGEQLKA